MLLGRKAMTNLDSILKSRDITLTTKFHLVKAMVFPVAMYRCESWTIKKAVRWRIDAFELWCWRRLLRVPWTARRSNQSILKEISPEYSLEELMLKRKLPILWPPDTKNWLIGKDPEGGRRSEWQDEMAGWYHRLNGHELEQALGVSDGQGSLARCSPWSCKELDMTKWLNWTEKQPRCSLIHTRAKQNLQWNNGILWSIITSHNMNEPQKHAKCQMPVTEDYIFCGFVYMACPE